MERVIHIAQIKNLKEFEPEKYNRIYVGADSCPNLLPKKSEIEAYFEFAKTNNLKITLLTSFCFDKHIEEFKKIIPLLVENKDKLDIEIVINDWGILQEIKNLNFKLVLGRLLTKQKKGPRVENILHTLSPSQLQAYKQVPAEFFEDFLIENNFIRIEIDNTIAGIDYNGKLPATLYYPYVFVSPSSFCLFFGKVSNTEKTCSRECLSNYLLLEDSEFKKDQYRKGNSFFYKNKDLPKEKANIDRLAIFKRI